MSQILTIDKARQLLKELQYAKAATGGQLSVKEEYYKQALEKLLVLWEQQEHGDGWIEWRGGECPVDDRTAVEVKSSVQQIYSGVAMQFLWQHDQKESDWDIIAYRIIPERGEKS